MLQDLSTDRHTAWQLQNEASMQPSDLLDIVSAFASDVISEFLMLYTSCFYDKTVCLRFGQITD